jgi:signal transduction histidine kinase/ActR/RegA family two-component response regulator
MSGSGRRSRNTKLRALAAGYGGATAAVLAAILARSLLEPWVGDQAPYILVFGAAAVAVWLGGAGPAVCAAVVGYTLINYLYIEPKAMLGIAHASDAVNLVLFVLACTLIITLGQAMRRARDRARISEAEARERAAQLELANAKKSEFLAVLSHELRNPLAPLRAGVEILKLESAGAPAPSILEMMERQVVHLTRLIDDLLDLSRIDRGKLELRKEYIALDAVVRNASETALPALEARRHELTVRSEGEPLYVHGDALRLSQVLSNLLNNAAKFTPPGGRIEVALRAENGHAVVSVADSGIGLAPEHLESVFEMFAQVKPGAAGGGLGLGLTLARSIVRRHGGELQAKSGGVGQGAEFVVRLPLTSKPAAEASPAPAPAVASAGPPRSVLIVDDNADAAHALGELLRLQGHRVEVAIDGEAALRAARASVPDIAFIDLNMPGMDGIELARRLRSAAGGHGVRLVALTGMAMPADIARTRDTGFDAHLTKPADPAAVARLILERDAAIIP